MRAGFMAVVMVVALPLAAAAAVEVHIVEPKAGEPVYGRIRISAEVESPEPIDRVLFFVDGSLVGQRTEPPYRVEVNLGQENADHEFQVVAYTPSDQRGRASLSTAAIAVNESIDLELRQLYVTVSRSGRRVLDLSQDSFRVNDDGAEQKLVTFGRGEVPLTAILLLDASESMVGERLASALAGARAFIDGLRSLDEAKVMLFSDQLLRAVPFTNDREALSAALDGVTASGGTAINDFLYSALDILESRQGRRVVVLFSDGADVHSVLPMSEVLAKAETGQELIYWIHLEAADQAGPPPTFSSSWRDRRTNQEQFEQLQRAVEESGGRAEILHSTAEIVPAFAEIMAELREQYVLGYYPSKSDHDGKWHDVKVRVDAPGVRVRYRAGYVDE